VLRSIGWALASLALVAACSATPLASTTPATKTPFPVSSPSLPADPSWVTATEPLSDDADPASTVSERERHRDGLLDPTFDVLAQQPGFQAGGLDAEVDEIEVFWNDQFGPDAQAAVEEAESRGVAVDVVPVPYSFDELREIAGRLGDALAAEGIELDGYRLGDPFDEVTVLGSALDGSAEARRIAEDTASEVLPPDLRFGIVTSPDALVPADSRHADGGRPRVGNGLEPMAR
jgi:hypothetical protein